MGTRSKKTKWALAQNTSMDTNSKHFNEQRRNTLMRTGSEHFNGHRLKARQWAPTQNASMGTSPKHFIGTAPNLTHEYDLPSTRVATQRPNYIHICLRRFYCSTFRISSCFLFQYSSIAFYVFQFVLYFSITCVYIYIYMIKINMIYIMYN